jgi:hypothetical protein
MESKEKKTDAEQSKKNQRNRGAIQVNADSKPELPMNNLQKHTIRWFPPPMSDSQRRRMLANAELNEIRNCSFKDKRVSHNSEDGDDF